MSSQIKYTAKQFMRAACGEIETAALLLLEEGHLVHTSVLDMIDRVLAATSRADLVRRARAALGWAVRRLAATDAGELLLQTLREVVGHSTVTHLA